MYQNILKPAQYPDSEYYQSAQYYSAIEMEYYSKGTLGTSGGPTLRLYENGSMGDIYINQRLRQSPIVDTFTLSNVSEYPKASSIP